ncbi:hypothetical protein [Actinoplanes sp. NPDC020271]|uniref:DUF6197 family protein n=1 Tax=Actinoplanes sp. NPDC020271 TaxID=3363896 RepID=UPI0037B860FC
MNPTQDQGAFNPDTLGAIHLPVDYVLTDRALGIFENPDDVARLLPDVVTRSNGHHPECCFVCDDEPLVTDLPADESADTYPTVLQSAALYLERHGWIQGAYFDATARVFTPAACMVGAVGIVCYGGPVEAPAQMFEHDGYVDFEQAIAHLDGYLLAEAGCQSYDFNDTRGRTLDEVTHALRQAASTPAEQIQAALEAQHGNGSHEPGTDKTCKECQRVCCCNFMSDKCVHCEHEDLRDLLLGGDA